MISLKPIKAGEEIYNDYGQLPRSDLLRRYGYITDAYSQWDVVEIDSSLIIERATNYHPLSIGEKQQRVSLPSSLIYTFSHYRPVSACRDLGSGR